MDPASLDSKRTARYVDGKHHWQEFQDDWTGPEAHRILDFLGWETIFQRRLDKEMMSSVSTGGNHTQEWGGTSARSSQTPIMPLADVEEEEFLLAHRDKLEEKTVGSISRLVYGIPSSTQSRIDERACCTTCSTTGMGKVKES